MKTLICENIKIKILNLTSVDTLHTNVDIVHIENVNEIWVGKNTTVFAYGNIYRGYMDNTWLYAIDNMRLLDAIHIR